MGMGCPRIGLCQPAISRRSPYPIAWPPEVLPLEIAPEDTTSCLAPPPVSQSTARRDRMERIPVVENGRAVSHLAVRFDLPRHGGEPRPCCLYLHGFGSSQSGEK